MKITLLRIREMGESLGKMGREKMINFQLSIETKQLKMKEKGNMRGLGAMRDNNNQFSIINDQMIHQLIQIVRYLQ